MPIGINNVTDVSYDNIANIANSTTMSEAMIRVNNLYAVGDGTGGGWLYFILLCTLGIILFINANKANDQPLSNALYVSVGLSILSFVLRAVYFVEMGVEYALLTDSQLWIFPVISILCVFMIVATKKE